MGNAFADWLLVEDVGFWFGIFSTGCLRMVADEEVLPKNRQHLPGGLQVTVAASSNQN